MLIDRAEVTFRGGHGGHGMPKKLKGPDGGIGGNGGNLYVEASSDISLLNQTNEQVLFAAGYGGPGARKNRTGKDGLDITVKLPVGTSIIEKKSGKTIVELTEVGQKVLICHGGRGGLGTVEPDYGEPGEEKHIILNLKLIADFGLIGLPNAGKSSLLNELTNAKAKVANYAFTTLEPNLGVFEGKYIADIPGLIEGASKGKGLGISFLKHIEKVGMLLHCISSESEDVIRDYEIVRSEMARFNSEIVKKPEIIILTKTDLKDRNYILELVKKLQKLNNNVFDVSIHDFASLEKLKDKLF